MSYTNKYNILFINEGYALQSCSYTSFKQGCEDLELPYHTLKNTKGYPKKTGSWVILKKEVNRAEYLTVKT